MRLLTIADLDFFFDRVAAASVPVLFLDYDGTVAPLRSRPRDAAPDPEVLRLLGSILEIPSARVVLVSGRRASELASVLGPGRRPEIWGSHGVERLRPNGDLDSAPLPEEARRVLIEEAAWWERRGWQHRLDTKPFGIVVNGRELTPEDLEELRRDARERWTPLGALGLVVEESEHGIELRLGGRDKGTTVRATLAEAGARTVGAYLGDDLSDETAFRAIRGRGIGALVRPVPRPTAAEAWLEPPGDVYTFLRRWHESACVRGCV